MNLRDADADRFEIVSGPEDGTEFPIVRTPFDVGADPSCGILLRLDQEVRPVHARVTVVAEGYRIRRLGNGPVWVNGKRAGIVRSRVVRNGGIVRVGRTDLCFVAAPEGLAGRSYGMPQENDLSWALRLLLRWCTRFVPGLFRFLHESFGGTLKLILPVVALLFALEYFWPGMLGESKYYAMQAWQTVRHWVTMLTGY